ncbi:MAG: HEAT repeat domain-containing protein [Asgard group archaeon]|nr:HEAT repeat domain-containing protein [Asgard group archaeon]
MLEDEAKSQMSREDIKQYLKDLKTGDTKSRAIAAYMLGTLGKTDKNIKKSLTKALHDKNWEVRKWAALSLGEMGERDSQLIPILVDVLRRDDSKEFRSHAAIILGELEKRAISAIPVLSNALQDDNSRVREWANWALNKIAGEKLRYRVEQPTERPSLSDRIRIVRKDEE